MGHHFKKHYAVEEARELLPHVRLWLKRARQLRDELQKIDQKLTEMAEPGRDLGGPTVNLWIRTVAEMKDVLLEFHRREIQIKDRDRGMLDFPAMMAGKEVFLCWWQEEEESEFWHELNNGYDGRERR